MSLDQNLFTLSLAASVNEPNAVDLTDPSTTTIHYRKRRHPQLEQGEIGYSWGLYDPVSDSLLATVTAGSAVEKRKTIELHNPSVKVNLAFTGTLSFRWSFDWEEHTFEWRREACFLIRKPDPPVQVAVTREPAGKIKTSLVQLLDFNLNRFDINDRKGLEIVMLSALLTFQDQSEEIHNQPRSDSFPAGRSKSEDGPPLPGKSGAEIVEAVQVKEKAQINEVYVAEQGSVDDYAHHCVKMLKDQNILFIIIRALTPEQVSKVVAIAEAAKRTHYKTGGHEQELHQYVTYEDMKQKGPRVIKLDDPDPAKADKYKPPQTLTIHLSKIPMPELQPRAPPKAKPTENANTRNRPTSWFGLGGSSSSTSTPPVASSSKPQLAAPKNQSQPNVHLRPADSHKPRSSSAAGSNVSDPYAAAKLSKQPPPQTRPPAQAQVQAQVQRPPPPAGKGKDRERDSDRDRAKEKEKGKDKGKDKEKEKEKERDQKARAKEKDQASKHKKATSASNANLRPAAPPISTSTRPSPPLAMPGAMPSSSSSRPSPQPAPSGFYPGFTSPYPQQPSPGSWAPPPGPPPRPQPQHQQSQNGQNGGLTEMLTNQFASVGYNLLDRLTNKTQPTKPH